jgi:hypothetical protein
MMKGASWEHLAEATIKCSISIMMGVKSGDGILASPLHSEALVHERVKALRQLLAWKAWQQQVLQCQTCSQLGRELVT